MIRRKLISAALFFALFGVIAFMPPFVLVFRTNLRLFGVPLDTIYVFSLWVALIIGGWWFSRLLPDDTPSGRSNTVDRK
jgi:hypothetical protein